MFSRRKCAAFSLIELLLVVAIMGILSILTIPDFIKSIRGNRLRTAGRSVVMVARYARTMALLKQQELAVVFDLKSSVISVHQSGQIYGGQADADAESSNVKFAPAANSDNAALINSNDVSPEAAIQAGNPDLSRKLEGVIIDYVEFSKGARRTKGSCMVLYRSNGTCTPYEVRIVDDRGVSITVSVDALSSVKTEGGG